MRISSSDPDNSDVKSTKSRLLSEGTNWLSVDDLMLSDLEHMGWSGDAGHVENMRMQAIAPGNSCQLVVRTPQGQVISKGFVDFSYSPDAAMIGQLATHPALQSLGVGTLLINHMEQYMIDRGLKFACLGVELINTPALRLYERLGYLRTHLEQHSWTVTDLRGEKRLYETDVQMMSKQLVN